MGAVIMWAFGDLPFATAIGVLLQRWRSRQEAPSDGVGTTVHT
jgi:hypothetical protein